MSTHTAETTLHTCKSCGNTFQGKYCNRCGEKVYNDHDKSLLHFFEEGFHFITHFEGTFFITLKTIFTRPGQLSADYCDGQRRKYFKPVSFFLLLVVLYLIFPFFVGLNMPLSGHLSQPTYGAYAQERVMHYLAEHPGVTKIQLAQLFAAKSEKTSKILLFSIIPACALLFWTLNFRRRPYYFDHLIFATEFNSAYLMVVFFITPLLLTIFNYVAHTFFHQNWPLGEAFIALCMYSFLAFFLAKASKTFYGLHGLKRAFFMLISLFWHAVVVYLFYKWLLFVTVFALLH